jgi:hypothetical protein
MLVDGYWLLVYWLLVIGYWLLVAYICRLVIGYLMLSALNPAWAGFTGKKS